jgi:hypothetical protein
MRDDGLNGCAVGMCFVLLFWLVIVALVIAFDVF